MTAKADFTEAEWASILEGPPSAGMLVMFAQRGGTLRESFAIAKAYVEARQHHGQSELLDEIVAAKPQMDHTRYHSPELAEYRQFVIAVAEKVAAAHREDGQAVSPAERAAIDQITQALGS